MKINIHRLYQPFLKYFRKRRMYRFCKEFNINHTIRVLDVGGSSFNWNFVPVKPKLVLSNISSPKQHELNNDWVIADGCSLPFKDKTFHLVYSNSVIEHLGKFENQRQFASECIRVGEGYYIQTPNTRYCTEMFPPMHKDFD